MTTIYIDDAGTPSYKSKSIYDTIDRKTWVALILNPEENIEANIQMRKCIEELKEVIGATEFHFTDIYSGNKEFKGIDLEIRLNIFRAFAEINRKTQFPMLIQTFTSDDMLRNKIAISDKKVKVDNFNLSETSDFALYFLLFRIKKYLKDNENISRPVEIIIDHGRQKKNTTQKCELLKDYLHNQVIHYKSSSDEPLLQFIDFVAFSMNRVRWILTNELKNSIDYEFLKICETANFNILNIKRRYVEFSKHSVDDYDKVLTEVYDKNNTFTNIELEEWKNMISK